MIWPIPLSSCQGLAAAGQVSPLLKRFLRQPPSIFLQRWHVCVSPQLALVSFGAAEEHSDLPPVCFTLGESGLCLETAEVHSDLQPDLVHVSPPRTAYLTATEAYMV